MPDSRKHLLLTPGPFFGHYIPMLEFAKKSVEFHDVTILVAKSKFAGIRDRGLLPPEPIKIVTFTDGLEADLDQNFSLTGMANLLKHLRPIYDEIIANLSTPSHPKKPAGSSLNQFIGPIDAVFWDMFFHCIAGACHERNIPSYAISFMPPAFVAKAYYRTTEETETAPEEAFLSGTGPPVGKVAECLKEIAVESNRNMHKCKGLLFNTFVDMDPDWEKYREDITHRFGIPTYCVGPLIAEQVQADLSQLRKWLDAQKEKNVVYFSFGTIGKTDAAQLEEIGKALLSLKKPFIWSLREFQQKDLPSNFELSTYGTIEASAPYLILPWVPQKDVLPHPSIGVFVSHCGWNSVLEAVYYGVPVAGWGFFGDQPQNADLTERQSLGLRVGKTGLVTDNVLKADQIAGVIRQVAGWETKSPGEPAYWSAMQKMREKAIEAVSPKGTSFKNLERIMRSL